MTNRPAGLPAVRPANLPDDRLNRNGGMPPRVRGEEFRSGFTLERSREGPFFNHDLRRHGRMGGFGHLKDMPETIDEERHYEVNLKKEIDVGGVKLRPGQRVHLLGSVLNKHKGAIHGAKLYEAVHDRDAFNKRLKEVKGNLKA